MRYTTIRRPNFIGDINRLEDGIVEGLNKEGAGLDPEMHHYIRLERLHVNKDMDDDHFVFDARVESSEYYGLYIKYTVGAFGQTLRVIEKNDGRTPFVAGDTVKISFNPANIMSYKA